MMLDNPGLYQNRDIHPPMCRFIESCVTFFDEHYRMQNRQRTGQEIGRGREAGDFPRQARARTLQAGDQLP